MGGEAKKKKKSKSKACNSVPPPRTKHRQTLGCCGNKRELESMSQSIWYEEEDRLQLPEDWENDFSCPIGKLNHHFSFILAFYFSC